MKVRRRRVRLRLGTGSDYGPSNYRGIIFRTRRTLKRSVARGRHLVRERRSTDNLRTGKTTRSRDDVVPKDCFRLRCGTEREEMRRKIEVKRCETVPDHLSPRCRLRIPQFSEEIWRHFQCLEYPRVLRRLLDPVHDSTRQYTPVRAHHVTVHSWK